MGGVLKTTVAAVVVVLAMGCGDDADGEDGSDASVPADEGPTECVDDLGCPGLKDCADCKCECQPFDVVWERDDLAPLLWAAASGERSYILRSDAPHLEVVGPDGDSVSIDGFDLEWLDGARHRSIHAAPDGSLVVVGVVAPIDGAQLHIERWSEGGEKLFADTFMFGDGSLPTLAGPAMSPDGTLVLAIRDWVATFSATDRFESHEESGRPTTTVGAVFDRRVIPSPTGSTAWVRGENGGFVYGFDRMGMARGDVTMAGAGSACSVTSDMEGNSVLGCIPIDNPLELSLARYDSDQTLLWMDEQVPGLAQGLNVVTLAAGRVSVAIAIAQEHRVRVQRHTAAGADVGSMDFGDSVRHTVDSVGAIWPADDEDFFLFLRAHVPSSGADPTGLKEIKRLRATTLSVGHRAPGESCGEPLDCESEVCCQSLTGEGACAPPDGCPPGASCSRDDDCGADMRCTRALGWDGPGVCRSQCTDDCEGDFVCASRSGSAGELLCLPDCLTEGDAACEDILDHTCMEVSGADGFDARACVGTGSPSSGSASGGDGGEPGSESGDSGLTPGDGAPGTICASDQDCETLDCRPDGLCAPRSGRTGEACTDPADCASFVCCLGRCGQAGECFDGDHGTPCLGHWECLTAFDCRGADIATGRLGYCSRDCVADSVCTMALGSERDAVCVMAPDGYCAATCSSDQDCEAGVTSCIQPAGASETVCDRP